MSTRHPLIGKILRLDEGDMYSVSRFTADLGSGYFLARRLRPRHGEELAMSIVVSLDVLSQDNDAAEIYDSWEAFKGYEKSLVDEDDDDADLPGEEVRHVH